MRRARYTNRNYVTGRNDSIVPVYIRLFFRMASSPTVMFDTRLLPHRTRTHTQSKNPPLPLTYQNYVRCEKGPAHFANSTNTEHQRVSVPCQRPNYRFKYPPLSAAQHTFTCTALFFFFFYSLIASSFQYFPMGYVPYMPKC